MIDTIRPAVIGGSGVYDMKGCQQALGTGAFAVW